ncbi:methylmalonate-semialdehyde dehydrogenase (acylating) [Actinophytocola xinjiangensis]|uniref:methylmalonate-semialdehyde dehydrogenase (CoA acylating) n=1 Tax=Actinophytocola xinjiangensis TaxID=485602 RepID=A0A7Z0WLU7_9PSEU|nr:CoA-acylating methylmalonate-semialdehyde dehydrogenase [Actinophytocola xinjiangensis]OLF10485.1 methylmalonate-semialdehyde dehydrogenase (acylating) [Actinophytocola xinjiangensis]
MNSPQLVPHYIDGARTPGTAGRTAPVFDPATGVAHKEVVLAGQSDVDLAVASAGKAAAGWAESSLSQRTRVLFAYRQLLHEHRRELAELITAEHGKVLDDAAGEVQRGLEVVEFACGIPHLLKGEHSEQVSRGVDAYSVRHPLGVVAGVTPFNFPVMVPMWMFPIAVACGNAFVLKPSERDPSAPVRLAELFTAAGLPDGVLNVLHGDAAAVHALLDHPDVTAVSFVGSTPIARQVYARGTAAGKRVQALGGAKNHMVVLPDADLDQAADAAVSAGFGSAGERCMAISAVVAVGDIADDLVAGIAERARSLRTLPGTDPMAQMGPLVTAAARDRVVSYVDAGEAAGATLVVDGRGHAVSGHDGFWVGPTVFDHVRTGMSIYTDEIFGPVLSVLRVDTLDEAIALVNANPYGNGTAVYTGDGLAAREYQRRVHVGMVGINVPIPVPMAYYSFGGWKDSLFGDTHAHGTQGVHFYTRAKAVTARWPLHHGIDLGFPAHA